MSPVINTTAPVSKPSLLNEAYRELADYLFERCTHKATEVLPLGVTSIERSAGVSTVARNLAIASAHAGRHTLLVAPTAPFGDDQSEPVSLHDVAKHEVEWVDAVHPTPQPELFYAVYGTKLPPRDQSQETPLERALLLRFERIVVDLPIISTMVDQPATRGMARDVVVVVRPDSLTRQQVITARQLLESLGKRNLGLIFNRNDD